MDGSLVSLAVIRFFIISQDGKSLQYYMRNIHFDFFLQFEQFEIFDIDRCKIALSVESVF